MDTTYQRHESKSLCICQSRAIGVSGIVIQPVGEGNVEASVQFLSEWVTDGEAEAQRYLADHAEPEGASLVATQGRDVVGYAAIVRESSFAGFRDRGIPLVHQVAVAGPFRRRGVATLLMDAAEQLARSPGVATPAGIRCGRCRGPPRCRARHLARAGGISGSHRTSRAVPRMYQGCPWALRLSRTLWRPGGRASVVTVPGR